MMFKITDGYNFTKEKKKREHLDLLINLLGHIQLLMNFKSTTIICWTSYGKRKVEFLIWLMYMEVINKNVLLAPQLLVRSLLYEWFSEIFIAAKRRSINIEPLLDNCQDMVLIASTKRYNWFLGNMIVALTPWMKSNHRCPPFQITIITKWKHRTIRGIETQ